MARGRTAKLSKRTVDAIDPPPNGYFRVWDTDLKGFCLRVRANGRKTYELRYRIGRRQTMLTIGDHGTFTAEQARLEAGEHKRLARRGSDPLAERRALRQAATVRELVDRYLAEGPAAKPNKRSSSWTTDQLNLRRHVEPLLGSKAVRDLTPADLARWQQDVAAGRTATRAKKNALPASGGAGTPGTSTVMETAEAAKIVGLAPNTLADLRARGSGPPYHKVLRPTQYERRGRAMRSQIWRVVYDLDELKQWANTRPTRRDSVIRGGRGSAARAMCSLSAMLAWAVQTQIVSENVARHVQKLPGGRRERFLSPAEATSLWRTMNELEAEGCIRGVDADLFRLLALTGARRGEILALRWSEIDFERGLIVLPPSRHKTGSNGRNRMIQLHAAAIGVLRGRQKSLSSGNGHSRRITPWVFPKENGLDSMAPPKRAWRKVTNSARLEGLRLHDLRHTYASLLVQDGIPLAIVGKALGHSRISTTERYAHLKDEAAQRASDHVASIYSPSSVTDKMG